MTELTAPSGAPREPAGQHAQVGEPARTPVLITERQVLFATAAAVPLQPAKTGRSWIAGVRGFLAAPFVTSSNEARSNRRHYSARNEYLEDSRMAREMVRL